MSQITSRRLFAVILAAAFAMITACSSSNSQVIMNPDTGKHIDNWQNPDVHGAAAKGILDSSNSFSTCQTCHGDLFAGGTSNVSCFPCHGVQAPHPARPWVGSPRTHTNTNPKNAPVCALCHTNGANSTLKPATPAAPGTSPGCFNNTLCHSLRPVHPEGWENPDQHGAAAKAAPGTLTGFSICQVCHGSDFAGGEVKVTCLSNTACHGVASPHPAKPWRSPLTARTHTNTDPLNAPACGFCHTNGANSSRKPEGVPVAGAIPGCFNNTLCHGPRPVHPQGWDNPDQHGVSAKAAPGDMTGFFICQLCHGSDFAGGDIQITCLNTCHGVPAPHPAKPWRSPLTARSHTTTDPLNGPVCGLCHTNGANSPEKPVPPAPPGTPPGCYNNTLCHGSRPQHPPGWDSPAQHGAAAKKAPDTTHGFSTCQICHGNDFSGGNVQVTCLNTCHGVPAPHPAKPWRSPLTPWTHTDTDPLNGPACGLCHRNGANSSEKPVTPAPPGTPPGCFNNTLCHSSRPAHPPGWEDPDRHGGEAKQTPKVAATEGFSTCQLCHGTYFNGGNVQVTCLNTCHHVPAPHSPKPWRAPLSPRTHTTTDPLNAASCYLCHANGANSLARPLKSASDGTSPDCFNNTLCHGSIDPHSAGWSNPSQHGAAAKSAPGSPLKGFSSCQVCHGYNLADCYGCHGVPAPHPPKPWLGTFDHTTTDPNNASVCGQCHKNGLNSDLKPFPPLPPAGTPPGCFNNTLCHGPSPVNPHPGGWGDPGQHGAAAKSAPGGTFTGFSSCEVCHGSNFTGGSSGVSCVNFCHSVGSAPHPGDWQGGGTYTHTTTNQLNASVCAQCHRNGNNSPIPPPSPPVSSGTTAGCFNGTLCHRNP